MRIVSFEREGHTCVGALTPCQQWIIDFCHPGCEIAQPASFLEWFNTDGKAWNLGHSLYTDLVALGPNHERMHQLQTAGGVVPKANVCLLAPVPHPQKFMCIGLNYRDHAAESGMPVPAEPVMFAKLTSAVTGPDAPVFLPQSSQRVDYEAELAVVIGRRCHRVSPAEAMQYVLGYTCVNDVSARDLQESDGQWTRAKSLDSFAPMGESLVTLDEIEDPQKLRIQFRLNGQTLQDSNTSQLIFGIAELVSFLSRDITLEPGDVISTGTPPGVGFARKPPIYLRDGDLMEVEIEGIGILRNPVKA
jgi:2-keto-4-pentenoate hydratase/2-oxohepta-3-ene-1,7-dioic acid hydratase in catechol pathway